MQPGAYLDPLVRFVDRQLELPPNMLADYAAREQTMTMLARSAWRWDCARGRTWPEGPKIVLATQRQG